MKVNAYCNGLILIEVPEEKLSISLYMPDIANLEEDVATTASIDDDKTEITFEWVEKTSGIYKTKTIILGKTKNFILRKKK